VILPNGYSEIVDFLAEGLGMRLEHVVTEIQYDCEGVELTTASGTVFSADRTVITVPIGVSKSGDIRFEPRLPQSKLDIMREIGSGTINKAWMKFPYAFWDTDALIIGHVSQREDIFTEWYSFDDLEDEAVLLGFMAGRRAIAIEQFSDEQITAEAMKVLRAMYGPDIPEPTFIVQSRWDEDPFAKGAYGYMAVGADVVVTREKLLHPVMKRLFFAGEATSADHYATTTVAMKTGALAAREIIFIQP